LRLFWQISFSSCPKLVRLTWKGCKVCICMSGWSVRQLSDLYLDDYGLHAYISDPDACHTETIHDEWNFYMFMSCHCLERLSIKNATRTFPADDSDYPFDTDILPASVSRNACQDGSTPSYSVLVTKRLVRSEHCNAQTGATSITFVGE